MVLDEAGCSKKIFVHVTASATPAEGSGYIRSLAIS
jgi:hypothetical protein